MLNLVTLPSGLYYARGLILIFRTAAMATGPSASILISPLSRRASRSQATGPATKEEASGGDDAEKRSKKDIQKIPMNLPDFAGARG